jgi:hypothetical protein
MTAMRKRLTRGQIRDLLHLDYLDGRAAYERRPPTPVEPRTRDALIAAGYARATGCLGVVITEAGRRRAAGTRRAFTTLRL